MKELVVISGKGGTGKTSIVAAFASLAENAVLADCDVDAADLHLILAPDIKQRNDFIGGKRASVITEKCIGCGKCAQVCNFDAAVFDGPVNDLVRKTYKIDPVACEGCGVCVHFCPADAIEFKDAVNGQWFISDTRFGPMVHAELGIAEENSGKLVSLIRKQAKQIAAQHNKDLIIVDGSPGIGCPVIASITAADLVLVVTEPTVSAQHDLERVIELAGHFKIPTLVCINKYDINRKMAAEIARKIDNRNIAVVGRIPYDTTVTKAQIAGQSIIEYSNNGLSEQIKSLWLAVSERLAGKEVG
ncbi:MAG: ATP-binding protein [Sedimentisphaerales bacterium]|nr:ATP-binding protein [Sedimentisphaerales bacterium]